MGTPPVGGQHAYFTALHEIGHVVCRHLVTSPRKPVLEQEAEAWRWSFEHALVQPNVATIKGIRRDLAAYWLWANTDRRATTKAPGFHRLWQDLKDWVPGVL